MVDFQSKNIDDESNKIYLYNQFEVLGNDNFDDDDFVVVCDGECPSAPTDISVSQEDFVSKDLDLKSISVK